MEEATRGLAELAQDKASKLDMLEDAEKRIENRLNDALLPKLVGYRFEHTVRFLELSPRGIELSKEDGDKKVLELPEEIHES
jgi:hypothetical protein